VWNDYSAYQYSAVAVTQTEIACISTLNFKNKLPSRFLALRYKLSELDHTESTNNLARLLRIESLDGWKSMLPLEDILPKVRWLPGFQLPMRARVASMPSHRILFGNSNRKRCPASLGAVRAQQYPE
jgi:hypothetical protein